MARPALYAADDILDAAGELIVEGGPAGWGVAGVAAHLGAPSGSIYHRFRSRDVLAGSLWLRTIERFQAGWVVAARHDDPLTAIRRAARYVVDWSRDHLDDARLLLLYRSSDLLTGDWPAELAARNRDQQARVAVVLDDLANRLGATADEDRQRVRFAALAVPYGAVRGPLSRGEPPDPLLSQLVDDAVVGVLTPIRRRRPP